MRPADAINRYAPPVAVMALIFQLSDTPDLSSGLESLDLVLRKGAHITIFAVLWLTLTRATGWRRPVAATVAALLYAATDEYHQTFVHGRHGSVSDVAIDALGMGVAALAWTVAARRRGGHPGPPWPLTAATGAPARGKS